MQTHSRPFPCNVLDKKCVKEWNQEKLKRSPEDLSPLFYTTEDVSSEKREEILEELEKNSYYNEKKKCSYFISEDIYECQERFTKKLLVLLEELLLSGKSVLSKTINIFSNDDSFVQEEYRKTFNFVGNLRSYHKKTIGNFKRKINVKKCKYKELNCSEMSRSTILSFSGEKNFKCFHSGDKREIHEINGCYLSLLENKGYTDLKISVYQRLVYNNYTYFHSFDFMMKEGSNVLIPHECKVFLHKITRNGGEDSRFTLGIFREKCDFDENKVKNPPSYDIRAHHQNSLYPYYVFRKGRLEDGVRMIKGVEKKNLCVDLMKEIYSYMI